MNSRLLIIDHSSNKVNCVIINGYRQSNVSCTPSYESAIEKYKVKILEELMQLSFIYRDDISVRGKLDGPLLHMLNELRKEVGISSSVL